MSEHECLIAAAGELAERLRAQGDGGAHELLREGGFYRALIARRHGGLELELDTFARVTFALARGCPERAWRYAVLACGALRARCELADAVQDEIFAAGDALIASAVAGDAVAAAVARGWSVTGTLAGCLGAAEATHCLGLARTEDGALAFVAAAEQFEPLRQGRGLRLEGALIEPRLAREAVAEHELEPAPAAIAALAAALAAVLAGAAQRAAEICEELARSVAPPRSPATARSLDPDHQRWLGAVAGRAGTAALLLFEATASCAQVPVEREPALVLAAVATESARLAWSAVEDAARTAAPPPGPWADELERLAGAALRVHGDPTLVSDEWLARELTRERLGLARS